MNHPTLPTFENLPIHALSAVFSDTTNSYKLYWMYAILDILKQESIENQLDTKDIAIRMVSLAWYSITVFKLSFGKLDQIGKTVKHISNHITIKDDEKPIFIHLKIKELCITNKQIDQLINQLVQFVPFRFLAPFFADTLRGQIDKEKNKMIANLSENSFTTLQPSIYKISLKQKVSFHPTWLSYLQKHLEIVESYTFWHLLRYLEARNPNVQRISTKLLPPQKRDLKNSYRFWEIVLNHQPLNCIYSATPLNDKISIDHFVPWSFVAHDYLWNLLPTTASVNSMKNNHLPKIDLYLPKFTLLQYEAFNIVFRAKKTQILEDYVFLFQDSLTAIAQFTENDFRFKLEKQIIPLLEVAANMGFSQNWVHS